MSQASVLEKWSPPPPCTSGKPHEWLLGNPEPHTGITRGKCRLCEVSWWWPRTGEQGSWTSRAGKRTQPEGLQEEIDEQDVPEVEMEAGIADDLQPVEPQVPEFGDGDSQEPVSQETPELPVEERIDEASQVPVDDEVHAAAVALGRAVDHWPERFNQNLDHPGQLRLVADIEDPTILELADRFDDWLTEGVPLLPAMATAPAPTPATNGNDVKHDFDWFWNRVSKAHEGDETPWDEVRRSVKGMFPDSDPGAWIKVGHTWDDAWDLVKEPSFGGP